MKIAVTSQNRKDITGHAGKCRKFWLYDVDGKQIRSKQLIELPLEQSFHEVAHANSAAVTAHPLDDIHLLICGGLGRGLQNRLKYQGIQAIATSETDPDQAVTAWLDGKLVEIDAEAHEGTSHEHHNHNDAPHRASAVFVAPAHIGRFSPATTTRSKTGSN